MQAHSYQYPRVVPPSGNRPGTRRGGGGRRRATGATAARNDRPGRDPSTQRKGGTPAP